MNASDWEQQAQFYQQDAATAWEKCEERRLEGSRLWVVIDWIDAWVSNPVGSYSVMALDGLFAMTRDRIAELRNMGSASSMVGESPDLVAAAMRVFDALLPNDRPMDWTSVTEGGDPQGILQSADWATAMRYASAASAKAAA